MRGRGIAGETDVPCKVTVCVGSSCHIHGTREILKQFAKVIREESLGGEVVLVGSFCLDRCGETMNWKFDDEHISSANVAEAEEALRARLAARLKRT